MFFKELVSKKAINATEEQVNHIRRAPLPLLSSKANALNLTLQDAELLVNEQPHRNHSNDEERGSSPHNIGYPAVFKLLQHHFVGYVIGEERQCDKGNIHLQSLTGQETHLCA